MYIYRMYEQKAEPRETKNSVWKQFLCVLPLKSTLGI